MKTQTLTTLLALLANTLLLANCKGEPSCPDAGTERYQYIDPNSKKTLPYNGFDTLLFFTNNNDTIRCIGNGVEIAYNTKRVRNPNPDCNVYDQIHYESNSTDYIYFQVEHLQTPLFPYDIWIPNYKIYWYDNIFSFYSGDIGTKSGDTTNTLYKYYDSININNIYYYEVSEFIDNGGNKLFINRSDGILKLYNTSDNNTWIKSN